MRKKITAVFLLLVISAPSVFADWVITQQQSMDKGMTMELTVWHKGVRERRKNRMVHSDPQQQAMMEKMMPSLVDISQCDLKQNVTLSEPKKSYFIDYEDWTQLTPEQKKRRPVIKLTIKGTMTTESTVEDSGKKQTMFGLEARWLKHTVALESSADSCDGKKSMRMIREGWFVRLSLEANTCRTQIPMGDIKGCRPRFIIKSAQNPGFFLEGTTKMYQDGKFQSEFSIKTTALSKATLDQSLFEIPDGWTEVDAYSELMPSFSSMMRDNTATTVITGEKGKSGKTVAIDFFSGNASKVNQDELRGYISQKLSGAGMNGFLVNSQADITTGNFANVIGVELKKVKESGASKIGGLFGKVTGNSDAAKIGDSEAEITITVYGKDGKTVVASASATQKVKGKSDDAVKAAIDQALPGLLEKLK